MLNRFLSDTKLGFGKKNHQARKKIILAEVFVAVMILGLRMSF